MKRFWREVRAAPAGAGHAVLLDERPLRTPARKALQTPNASLAAAVAEEWRAQGDEVEPASMPLTRLSSTAIDRMPALRDAALNDLAGMARTDLVCYRAGEPLELLQRQHAAWTPLVDWLAAEHGARLVVTEGLLPVEQPGESLERLADLTGALDDWRLVGLHAAAQPLGSFVLGLAVLHDRLEPEAALQASLVDELFEIEHWGWDVEIERRHQALRADVHAAGRFLRLLDEP